MMKKLVLPLGIVLVLVNIVILSLDDEGQVGRTNFIPKWEQVTAQDVKETLSVPAVLTSAEEVPVYLDPESGSMSEILVRPGDTIEEGDDLFTYKAADYGKTYRELTAAITTLEQQAEAVEQAISAVEGAGDIEAAAAPMEPIVPTEDGGDADAANEALRQATEEQTAQMQEQYRIGLEKELAQKHAELTVAEAQLSELEETGEYVTVTSPSAGTVKSVRQTGEGPIVTLESKELVISGELTEAERKQVQDGMTVEAKLRDSGPVLEGEITDLAEQPVAAAQESTYRFEASYASEEEQTDQLVAGYHLDTDILLDFTRQAPAVKPSQVKDDRIWKMANGQLFTAKVEIGAQNDKQTAVTSGLEAGAFIPAEQGDHYQNEPFVTPWKPHQMAWSTWKDSFTGYEFLLGLLDH